MPTSLHPQAKFDPISPDLDIYDLVENTANLQWVQRVPRSMVLQLQPGQFEKIIAHHVIDGGNPLVIEGYEEVLDRELFSVDWLEANYDKKQESVRDIVATSDIPMTMGHYLRSMKQLTNQWTPTNYRDERRQRLYLKDIDCPPEWHQALQKTVEPTLFYLNDHIDPLRGAESQAETRKKISAAPAGDLMSSLPEEMRAQNLMCYVGHEGTYTPAHREMCASLGQNIMVEASGNSNGERPGCSLWFMTESKDREVVREYFLSMLGHDIEIEKHFAQVNAWKKAPFNVYVVEQKPGDFILIPPLAAHQVWNRGTRTMKVAWNRTTPETLELALQEALPKARLVCRDEQYKNKAIIYYTLEKYYNQLQTLWDNAENAQFSFMESQNPIEVSPRAKQLAVDFKKLLSLFASILIDEMFAYREKDIEFVEYDSCVTCSYCRANIFNRFLTCKHCVRTLINGDEDAYDICMECYAMGRSCVCLSRLQWCEQWSWPQLMENYELWRSMVIKNDGYVDFDTSPQPLEIMKQRSGKKSVAQLCQDALRRRPWNDITKQEREVTPSDSEPNIAVGEPARKKSKRKKKKGELRRCHVCCHKDHSYRVHECTNPGCSEAYCYGVLYRAFDMMPQKVLEDEQWQCPKCLGICNCGACRRSGNTNAYMPKNTLLGHDTRPIADDRSVEALVDFRIHNLSWLKAAGEQGRDKDSRRMRRLRAQADDAKAQEATEQVQVEQAITEGGPVQGNTGDISTTNGYGDQSHILEHSAPEIQEFAHHGLQHLREAVLADRDGEGVPSAAEHAGAGSPETSMYPDPSLLARQRIGLGYYEPDDTPNKILFDHYQAPSADAMKLDEPGVPEFVKKSIRAAKRKAKKDNDDPDFIMGKAHHKKLKIREPLPEMDMLDNMDPALFAAAAAEDTAQTNLTTTPTQESNQQCDESAEQAPPPPRPRAYWQTKGRPPQWFDANEIALRPAKPRVSYADLDEAEINEVDEDDIVIPRQRRPSQSKNSVDLVADVMRTILGESHRSDGAPVTSADGQSLKTHKRRGRPPKRLSMPDTNSVEMRRAVAEKDAVNPKPRSRSTRTSRSVAAAEEDTMSDVEAYMQPQRDRHLRQSGVTTIAAGSINLDDKDKDPNCPVKGTTSAAPAHQPKRRGRPPKQQILEGAPPAGDEKDAFSPPSRSTTPNAQFMSMAQRMALKGKNFKMVERKPVARLASKESTMLTQGKGLFKPISVSPAHPSDEQDGETDRKSHDHDEPSASSSGRDDGASPSVQTSPVAIAASRTTKGPEGRTVVRLDETHDEDEEFSLVDVVSAEDDTSSDDSDIPATIQDTSSRGRGTGRGRKRGRGRGKGRGRGRGRGN